VSLFGIRSSRTYPVATEVSARRSSSSRRSVRPRRRDKGRSRPAQGALKRPLRIVMHAPVTAPVHAPVTAPVHLCVSCIWSRRPEVKVPHVAQEWSADTRVRCRGILVVNTHTPGTLGWCRRCPRYHTFRHQSRKSVVQPRFLPSEQAKPRARGLARTKQSECRQCCGSDPRSSRSLFRERC
jgi:hypothetical protein